MTVLSQSQSQSQNPINVVYHLYRMAQAIQSPSHILTARIFTHSARTQSHSTLQWTARAG